MQALLQFFGRLHPMLLHAPIGLLIGLAGLEVVAMARRSPVPPAVRATLAWMAAAAGVITAATGWTLSFEGGFDPGTVQLHEWLGIGVAAACVLACVLQQLGRIVLFRAVLALAAIAVIPTGHLGGSMTYGEDFLFEPLRSFAGKLPRGGPSAEQSTPQTGETGQSKYALVIAPVFQSNCIACHGPKRHKGGLALDTPEAIGQGGDTGPVIVAGDPGRSEVLRRLRLLLEDEDHMPPKGKRQPSADDIKAIEDWIASGASFDSSGGSPPSAESKPSSAVEAPPAGPPEPDAAAVRALQDRLVYVGPLEQGSHLLIVDFAAVAPQISVDDAGRLLEPLREQICELSIARSQAGDGLMGLIARMPNLHRLNAAGTPLTDAGLSALGAHPRLEQLVVTQTHLTDAAAEILGALPSLKQVYVWQSGVSPEAQSRLREHGIVVEAGDAIATEPAESETEIKLTADAPLPGQTPAASLTPINTICPVSGKPVDPNFAIVYKGKVIGFCCQHCPAEFWADPAKFEDKLKP